MDIGNRIKQARTAKGLSQLQLSQKLNISSAMISQYERGERNPKQERILEIANVLDVPASYLLGWDQIIDTPSVYRNLKLIREKRGKTQEDFAKILGMTPGYYQGIEEGFIRLNRENLLILAKDLNIDVSQLTGYDDKMPYSHKESLELLDIEEYKIDFNAAKEYFATLGYSLNLKIVKIKEEDKLGYQLKNKDGDTVILSFPEFSEMKERTKEVIEYMFLKKINPLT